MHPSQMFERLGVIVGNAEGAYFAYKHGEDSAVDLLQLTVTNAQRLIDDIKAEKGGRKGKLREIEEDKKAFAENPTRRCPHVAGEIVGPGLIAVPLKVLVQVGDDSRPEAPPVLGAVRETFFWPHTISKKVFPSNVIEEWKKDSTSPWLSRGSNHRETADALISDVETWGWFLEVESLDHLFKLVVNLGGNCLISRELMGADHWVLEFAHGCEG